MATPCQWIMSSLPEWTITWSLNSKASGVSLVQCVSEMPKIPIFSLFASFIKLSNLESVLSFSVRTFQVAKFIAVRSSGRLLSHPQWFTVTESRLCTCVYIIVVVVKVNYRFTCSRYDPRCFSRDTISPDSLSSTNTMFLPTLKQFFTSSGKAQRIYPLALGPWIPNWFQQVHH